MCLFNSQWLLDAQWVYGVTFEQFGWNYLRMIGESYRQSGEVIKGWNSGVLDLDLEPDITICYLCDLG